MISNLSEGERLFQEGKIEDAKVIFQNLLQTTPDYPGTLNNLGVIAFSEKNLQEAEKYFLRAQELDGNYPEVYLNLANIYFSNGNPAEASKFLGKCFSLNHNDFKIYNQLGFIYLRLKDIGKAKLSFEKSLELKPDQKEAGEALKKVISLETNQKQPTNCTAKHQEKDYPIMVRNMFSKVYFEISGICNGRCYWCQTGQSNMNKISTGKFVNMEEFQKSIHYMLDNGFINENSLICLYNWGEPFLHPKFRDIIKFLDSLDIKIALSTNASKPVFFDKGDELKYLVSLTFSMAGFSQYSYDKIHGFNFEKIKRNIVDISENFRDAGFNGKFVIAFHIYQFNTNEILPMIEFAKEHGLTPSASLALINDFERGKKYIKKEIEYEYLYRATKELFLFYYDEMPKEIPNDYVCAHYSNLFIDSDCNVITCCGDSTIFDKVYHLRPEHVNPWRINGEVCIECNQIGLCYLGHIVTNSKNIVIMGK